MIYLFAGCILIALTIGYAVKKGWIDQTKIPLGIVALTLIVTAGITFFF